MPVTRFRPARLAHLAALTAAVLALSACGGGDDAAAGPSPVPAPVPAPPPPAPVISAPTITAIDGSFEGYEGGRSTLTATVSSPDEAPTFQWYEEGVAIPGATAATLVTSPAAFGLTSYMRTFTLRVTNSAGVAEMTRDYAVYADSSFRWQDAGAPDGNSLEHIESATVTDAAGRSHVAYLAYASDYSLHLRLGVVSANGLSESAAWVSSFTPVPLAAAAVDPSAQGLAMAASADGRVMAVWNQSEVDANQVRRWVLRAALYTPNASDPQQPGAWAMLGTVSGTGQVGVGQPAVASSGPGQFEIAWTNAVERGDVYARRWSNGSWGDVASLESLTEDFTGDAPLLLAHAGGTAAMFRSSDGGWRMNYRAANASAGWEPANAMAFGLPGDHARPVAAVNAAGVAAVAARNRGEGSQAGRVLVRRFDLTLGGWSDGWTYAANAYGSDPAVLIDDSGRIDVFGISVDTSAGNTSVLGQWTFQPASGWGAGQVRVSNAENFGDGAGLRQLRAGRDAVGNIVLVWLERGLESAPPRGLRSLRYSARDNAWTAPVEVVAPAAGVEWIDDPALSVNPSGRATVLWTTQRPTAISTTLQAARLKE